MISYMKNSKIVSKCAITKIQTKLKNKPEVSWNGFDFLKPTSKFQQRVTHCLVRGWLHQGTWFSFSGSFSPENPLTLEEETASWLRRERLAKSCQSTGWMKTGQLKSGCLKSTGRWKSGLYRVELLLLCRQLHGHHLWMHAHWMAPVHTLQNPARPYQELPSKYTSHIEKKICLPAFATIQLSIAEW